MDKASTESKILNVALREFAVHGVEGVSARQIAKKAEVNHACINYYFGSKQEMYLEIVKRANVYFKEKYAAIYAEVNAFLATETPSKERAKDYLKEILALTRRDMLRDSFASFQLLVRREEVFPTEAFDLLFEGVFAPHIELMSALVSVVKKGMDRSQSLVLANLFMSMNLSQINCREGITRLHNKEIFDEELGEVYSNAINLIIESTLI